MIEKLKLNDAAAQSLRSFEQEALSLLIQFFQADDLSLPLNRQIQAFAKHDRKLFSKYYDTLHYLPSLLSTHGEIARQLSLTPEIGNLITGDLPKVRVDLPGEEMHLDPWHQEIAFYDAPLDSFTVWTPFQYMDDTLGPVEFIEGSEKAPLLTPKYSNTRPYVSIVDFAGWDKKPFVTKSCALGECLVFNHSVIHRSSPNRTPDLPRCSLQFRFNRVDNPQQRENHYPPSFKLVSVHNIEDLGKNRTFS